MQRSRILAMTMHFFTIVTIVALAVAIIAFAVAVIAVAVAPGSVVRASRGGQGSPRDVTPRIAPTDSGPAKSESPPEPAEPAEPAPREPSRATIPPMVVEALASEPETATATAAATEPAPASVPTLVPAPAPTPVPAPAAPVAPPRAPQPRARATQVDRAAIEAEDPERKKARKLARLFVSEIKLYNEKLTAEGLAAGDLYTRLREPIDQSLVVFRRRVPEVVRAEFDYMHDELVRQLACGDASKLGPDYRRLRRG